MNSVIRRRKKYYDRPLDGILNLPLHVFKIQVNSFNFIKRNNKHNEMILFFFKMVLLHTLQVEKNLMTLIITENK